MTSSWRRRSYWGLILVLCQWPSAGFAQDASEEAPSFSKAQSAAGRTAYRQHCASCHGPQLRGQDIAPSLVGSRFDRSWRGKPAEEAIETWYQNL